jgi:tetratricopeptide (TPR) repeat protein
MTPSLRLASLLLLLAAGPAAFAQTPAQEAETKGRAAIELMDEGKLNESINLLQEARRLDPTRSAYSYELSYAYYQQKKYPQALELAEPLVTLPDASDRTFELLGNLYDNSGNSAKAIATYETGLRKFPKSGRLQLELGIVYMGKKDYDKALGYFELLLGRAAALQLYRESVGHALRRGIYESGAQQPPHRRDKQAAV